MVGGVVAAGLALTAGRAFAAEGPTTAELGVVLDTLWLLVAGVLVFFMQAGFALVTAGSIRSKNTVNMMMKNLMDFCLAAIAFWMLGYGIAYGTTAGGLMGTDKFFLPNTPGEEAIPLMASWFFQVVFAGTAATIVAGAMAERTKFQGYLIYSFLITLIIYPVVVHWIWSGAGWLNDYNADTTTDWGFTDFAGSTVVHSVGGWAALMGALILGPRLGRFGPNARPMQGHNVSLLTLGVFILWFGWFGFNGGSQLFFKSQADANSIALAIVNTTLGGAAGAIGAMMFTWLVSKKPDAAATMNGVLAGLVAITAGCAYFEPISAIIVGVIGGVLYVLSVGWMEKAKIDDPVGAVPVHLVCGIWGTLAIGLFATSGNTGTAGLFVDGTFTLMIGQVVGIIAVGLWTCATCGAMFFALKTMGLLRVSKEEEETGLDIGEHGTAAYPEELPAGGKVWAPGAAD